MLDMSMHEISRTRYDEMLRDAEHQRKIRRLRKEGLYGPSLADRVLLAVSKQLIRTGDWLQHRIEMQPGLR
ncbi:MAG: hypothetical protein R3A44_40070 [Caldilineaceae bacterium]